MRVSRTAMISTSQVDTSGGSSPLEDSTPEAALAAADRSDRRPCRPTTGTPARDRRPAMVVPTTPAPITNTVGVGSENSSGSLRELRTGRDGIDVGHGLSRIPYSLLCRM